MFARSLAGHDKGRLYVVTGAEEGYVLLSDGERRTLQKPKKKKVKHVQPDFSVSEHLREMEERGQEVRDPDIRKALRIKEETTCQKQM